MVSFWLASTPSVELLKEVEALNSDSGGRNFTWLPNLSIFIVVIGLQLLPTMFDEDTTIYSEQ